MQSAESDRRNTRQISRSVESERSVDATDRNNNLTPCSPEFPEPVVPIYESTFCLCGNKHFNLRERERDRARAAARWGNGRVGG